MDAERILPHFPMIVVQEEQENGAKKEKELLIACRYTCSAPSQLAGNIYIIRERGCRISDFGKSVSNSVVSEPTQLVYIHTFMHAISHKWTCEHYEHRESIGGGGFSFKIFLVAQKKALFLYGTNKLGQPAGPAITWIYTLLR